jgi:hypothetical protein
MLERQRRGEGGVLGRRLLHRILERSSTFRNYTHSKPRFRALLTEGDARVVFHLRSPSGAVRSWLRDYVPLYQRCQERLASTPPCAAGIDDLGRIRRSRPRTRGGDSVTTLGVRNEGSGLILKEARLGC